MLTNVAFFMRKIHMLLAKYIEQTEEKQQTAHFCSHFYQLKKLSSI